MIPAALRTVESKDTKLSLAINATIPELKR